MDPIALLLVLAAIAASLVGFTALLTAFRTDRHALVPNDVSNIRILVMFSVSALIFALLPIPLLAFDVLERGWRPLAILIGIFLAIWLIQSPLWMRRKGIRPRSPLLYWPMLVAQAALGMVILVGALASLPAAPFYVVGVLWCLLTAIVAFVVQIFVMLPVTRDENST